jgi:hypothetical protein
VNEAELKAARERWERSKAALRAAKTHSDTTADWLRYGGTAVALIGLVGLMLERKRRRLPLFAFGAVPPSGARLAPGGFDR